MKQIKSGELFSDEQRQTFEATHTWQRIVELRHSPVHGNFDAAHLKEINRRIFQDLPGLGFSDVTPGQFRPSVPAQNPLAGKYQRDIKRSLFTDGQGGATATRYDSDSGRPRKTEPTQNG